MRALVISILLTACANQPPYAHCGGSDACAMGQCYELAYTRSDGSDADGNVCTTTCQADADCVDDGVCVALEHDASRTFFCAERCMDDGDCHAPLTCAQLVTEDGTMFGACLP